MEYEAAGASVMERCQTKVVKPKMTGRQLRIAVHWQVALEQGGVKQGSRVYIFRPRVVYAATIH